MALVTSAIARGLRCPVCGEPHATCGGPSGSVPADAGLYDEAQGIAELQAAQQAARAARKGAGMDRVKVDRGDGNVFNLSEDDAQKFMEANPGAKRVGGPRRRSEPAPTEMEEAATKAVKQADVEDKAVMGPRGRGQ